MLESVFSEFFTDLSTSFSNPQKRVFIGYIFCAFTLGIFWLVYKKSYDFKSALTVAFSKRTHIAISLGNCEQFIFLATRDISKQTHFTC